MSAEDSVRSGKDGEKIANEILKLIGWGSVSNNFNIDCSFPSKHKSENKNKQSGIHGLDILYSFDNPLFHDRRDIIVGSAKHSIEGYPSGLKTELAKKISELSITLHCAKESDKIIQLVGTSSLKTHYKGILFWFSSNEEEKEFDLTQHIDDDIDFDSNQFEEIYIVDNKRATFLVSCIKVAEAYMPSSKVKFLHQNTGKSQLLLTGDRLPVQLINSEIIPIVKEEHGKISCLIFCNNLYSKEIVSRLIWLAHKLCGLTNEVRIYLPNYDANTEYEVNAVKTMFKDEAFTTKISFHRMPIYEIIALKEEQSKLSNLKDLVSENIQIKHSEKLPDDIDKILPFGDFLMPKLKTSILSEVNLRHFLTKKGIITYKKTKEQLLPIFSCLLLSPHELDSLKAVYKEKEDKPKVIERNAKIDLGEITLWETFSSSLQSLKSLSNIRLPKNCILEGHPLLERVNENNNHLIVKYKVEKENTNKDFLTGKTPHEGKIEIIHEKGELTFIDTHTSAPTYQLNLKYFDSFRQMLKRTNLLVEDFKAIKFLDFENNQRVQFLLGFLKLRESSALKITHITPEIMKFKVDENINSIPRDLESLKGRVSNLKLQGKELDDTVYLADEAYRKAIFCEMMQYRVEYSHLNKTGICHLEITFNGAISNEIKDAELQISIIPNYGSVDTNFSKTKMALYKEITIIRDTNYKKFKLSNV